MEHLTAETFKEKVFDFEKEKEWKFLGDKPCIVDFYADWCGPCRMLAPVLEELSKKYEGKLNIYKVNVDQEQLLSSVFGIESIPTILFIPLKGQPKVAYGYMPIETMEKVISEMIE